MSPRRRVRVSGLVKDFGGTRVLDGIDLDVPRGEVTCIIGPSGSGKSTLLRCIAFLEEATGGLIEINGEPLGFARRRLGRADAAAGRGDRAVRSHVGMVFQQFNLWPHMTALGNVAEALVRVARHAAQGRPRPARWPSWGRRPRPPRRALSEPSSPAASSSGWPSPAPWRWSRRSCCSTSRPPRSIPS